MPAFYLYSLALALGMAALYCAGLYCAQASSARTDRLALAMPIIFIAITVAAHLGLAAPGRVSLLALPVGWALAFVPHYIFSYHIDHHGFFGHKFTFQVLGTFYLAPPLALSLLLALFTWLRR